MIKTDHSVLADVLQRETKLVRTCSVCYCVTSGCRFVSTVPLPLRNHQKQQNQYGNKRRHIGGRGLHPLAPPGATTFADISALSKNCIIFGLAILKLACNENLYCLLASKISHK
jgi:hypothetical protein